ncbi:type I pantothenate kinase, partial [Streptomyces sp. SID8455]|nr:type I pantothenate kinase [Streptomyces sp. SID8455]
MITSPARSPQRRTEHAPTPYVDLSRDEWSALRDKTPLPLTADEVERLRGLGDVIDLDEVRDVYLPLSRLLNL